MTDLKLDVDTIRKNCEEFFGLYNVAKNDIYDMCELKIIHTRAVADNCLDIARNMGLDEYDCNIAWIIGELHDFARFGQAVVTGCLDDSDRFNHAHLGARILFTHHLIDDIIPDYDRICEADRLVMEKAVYHHSDYILPDDLTERELLFCKIIREADQLDIFRVIVESGWEINYGCTLNELLQYDISDAMKDAFYEHRLAEYSKRVTPADFHMAHIALCFGLGSASARKRAIKQGYLEKMMDIEFSDPKVQAKYTGMKEQALEFLYRS
ncbi:MAG: HD domain-containing protein [Lachnospiraceae bacterium]|nr:HD domain-containing protein [Lachnospiraceae bacterium]